MSEFESGQTRARWIYATFSLLTLLSILSIIFTIIDASLIQDLLDGRYVSPLDLEASDDRMEAVHWTHFGVMIIGAIVCLVWIHRAYSNLFALRAQNLSFSPGWAVGWFFIPVAQIFQPYRVTSELWKGSDPNVDVTDGTAWKNLSLPFTVVVWWVLFLAAWIARCVTGMIAEPDEPSIGATLMEYRSYLEDLQTHRYAYVVSHCVYILGFIVTMYLVRVIDKRQKLKHDLLPYLPENPDPGFDKLEQSIGSNDIAQKLPYPYYDKKLF